MPAIRGNPISSCPIRTRWGFFYSRTSNAREKGYTSSASPVDIHVSHSTTRWKYNAPEKAKRSREYRSRTERRKRLKDIITLCKEQAVGAMNGFLHVLSFVPEDKLTWSPSPTAKNALQIAAHCAGHSGAFAGIISAGKFPDDVEEFLGPIRAATQSIATLEQAEGVLRKGIADTIAALDRVTPEQVDSLIDAPGLGTIPFTFCMTIPARHLNDHTSQIDYLQTCWDDQVVHV